MVDLIGFIKEYILGPLINLIVEDCYKYIVKLNLLRVILYFFAGLVLAIVMLAVDKSFFSGSEFRDLYLVGILALTLILAHVCVPSRPEKPIIGLTFTVVHGFLAYVENDLNTNRLISCLLPLILLLMTRSKDKESQKENAKAAERQAETYNNAPKAAQNIDKSKNFKTYKDHAVHNEGNTGPMDQRRYYGAIE